MAQLARGYAELSRMNHGVPGRLLVQIAEQVSRNTSEFRDRRALAEVLLALAEIGHYPESLMHPLSGIHTAISFEPGNWEPDAMVKVCPKLSSPDSCPEFRSSNPKYPNPNADNEVVTAFVMFQLDLEHPDNVSFQVTINAILANLAQRCALLSPSPAPIPGRNPQPDPNP